MPGDQSSAPKCGFIKRNGSPCQLEAGWGTDHRGYGHCRRHMGNTPNHIKHAVKEKAIEERLRYGGSIDVSPHELLLEEVRRSAGLLRFAESKAHEATEDEYLGVKFNTTAAWVQRFDQERRHAAQVAKMAVDAGVAERFVALQEQQGRMVADVMRAVVAALYSRVTEALPEGDLAVEAVFVEEAPKIMRNELMKVEAGDENVA